MKAMTAKKEKKKAKKAMKANERDEVHDEGTALNQQELDEFFDWLVADNWRPMKAMNAMKANEGYEASMAWL